MDSGSFFVDFICRSRICAPVYAVFPAGMVSFPPKKSDSRKFLTSHGWAAGGMIRKRLFFRRDGLIPGPFARLSGSSESGGSGGSFPAKDKV